MPLANEQRWKVVAVSPREFDLVAAHCAGSQASRMLKIFGEGSLGEQQAALTHFLRSCEEVADTANMYLYNCGTFFVRFFVHAEGKAVIVLTFEGSISPEGSQEHGPSNLH